MSEFHALPMQNVVPAGVGLSAYSQPFPCSRWTRKTIMVRPKGNQVSVTIEVPMVDENCPPGDWSPRKNFIGGTALADQVFSVTIEDAIPYVRVKITAVGAPPSSCVVVCNLQDKS